MKLSRNILYSPFILITVLFAACAAHSNLEPVGKGSFDLSLSVGGPVVSAFGTKVPIPYATAGTNYGLTDRWNINGNFHLLPFAFQVAGIDLGATWFPVLNRGAVPTVGIQPGLLIFSSFKSGVDQRFRAYPMMSGSLAWQVGQGLFYTGFDSVLPLSSPDYDDESPSVIFSPFLGYHWRLGSRTYLLTELKWQAANVENGELAIQYMGIGDRGAVTPLVSIVRNF
ncbi:hypothetical protein ACFL47_10915 [Candidatus Latescibacterota bacterium]